MCPRQLAHAHDASELGIDDKARNTNLPPADGYNPATFAKLLRGGHREAQDDLSRTFSRDRFDTGEPFDEFQ